MGNVLPRGKKDAVVPREGKKKKKRKAQLKCAKKKKKKENVGAKRAGNKCREKKRQQDCDSHGEKTRARAGEEKKEKRGVHVGSPRRSRKNFLRKGGKKKERTRASRKKGKKKRERGSANVRTLAENRPQEKEDCIKA